MRHRLALYAVALVAVGVVQSATAANFQAARTPLSPSAIMPPGQLTENQESARAFLRGRLAAAKPGTKIARDLKWLLRLAGRYGRPDQPSGRRATIGRAIRVNAWWYRRYGSPSSRVVLRDSDGVLLTYREYHGFMVNPVATFGRWRGLNRAVPNATLARTMLRMTISTQVGATTMRTWEYYDISDKPNAIRPGVSAMAQARGALLLSQAYRQTGDPGIARANLEVLNAFRVPVNGGGVVSPVAYPANRRPSPWYVERAYPGENPWKGAALNGFMVSILDLERVAEVLGRPPLPPRQASYDQGVATGPPTEIAQGRALAAGAVDDAVATLRRYLPLHDNGKWSLYGLLTPGYGWRQKVADLNYHCYHVHLLNRLEKDFPGQGFARWAAKWQKYARDAGEYCPDQLPPTPGA
ncbi:MAG: hypothetical protein HYX33_03760 [Actinobacteria bacterium]|nr:hypothetical protein [Actinomycetota bacterium]